MPRRALIVEDDPPLAELLEALMGQMDYQCTILGDGLNAAQWVRQHRPDLVLLDLMLPGRSGYDICQELKLDRETNLIPIVIVTARTQREDMLRGLRVGANFYLTKPFTIEQLEHAVATAVAQRRELERCGTAGEIHFQLDSDRRSLEELNALFSSLLLYTPLTDDEIFQLTTAVREMGNNAIEWGNRNRIEQPVTVTYRIDSEKVTIVIRDQGSGFNLCDCPHAATGDDPTAHLDARQASGLRAGGLGIFMTRQLVDELHYNDTGNEVTLVKRFSRPG